MWCLVKVVFGGVWQGKQLVCIKGENPPLFFCDYIFRIQSQNPTFAKYCVDKSSFSQKVWGQILLFPKKNRGRNPTFLKIFVDSGAIVDFF